MKGPTSRHNFLNIAKSTWNRMVRKHLGLRAYKIQKKLQIEPGDVARRLNFARNYVRLMDRHPEYLWLWRYFSANH